MEEQVSGRPRRAARERIDFRGKYAEDDDSDSDTLKPIRKLGEESDDEKYDSDKDPAWTPANADKNVPAFEATDFEGKRKRSKGKVRSRPPKSRKMSGESLPINPQRVQEHQVVELDSGSEEEQLEGVPPVCEDLQVGDFVIEKKDEKNTESYPIWKIESGRMLHKFELFTENSRILHRSIPTFSSWQPNTRNSYRRIRVNIVFKQGEKEHVEVLEESRPKPALDSKLEEKYEEHPLVDAFNVYLQILLSQALEPGFLSAIREADERFYLDALEKIDNAVGLRLTEIDRTVQWKDKFKEAVKLRPHIREIDRPNLKQSCQACAFASQPAIKSVHLFGNPYDRFSLQEITPDGPHTPMLPYKVMRIFALCGLVLHLTTSSIWCYPTGAPLEACDGMFPIGHGMAAQTATSPFTMTLSSSTFCPSSIIDVTVSGRDFKGFLCQARTDVNTYETVGTLSGADNTFTTINNCGNTKAALTQADRNTKNLLRLKWKPSATTPMNNVYIVCTVVVERPMFWVKQYATLTYAGMTACTASSPCSAAYFTLASSDTCKESWMKYKATNDSTQCQHYEQFLSCIRYQALIRGQTCQVGDIHSAIAAAVMAQNKSAQICPNTTVVDVENRMPTTAAGICKSAYVMSHMLYYICKPQLQFKDYMTTTDPEYRCQLEDQMRLCVLDLLKGTAAGCTNIDDVSSTFSNADLRSKNSLDTTVNCDTRYGCQSFMKLKTGNLADKCFNGMLGLLYLPSLPSLVAYTSSYLKCKAYELTMGCFLVEYGASAAAAGCNLTQLDKDIHPDFLNSLVNAAKMLSPQPQNEPIVTYDQCKAPSFPQMPECPTEATLVETVTIYCAAPIYRMVRLGADVNNTCSVLLECKESIEDWYVDHNICANMIGHHFYMAKKSADGAKYFKVVTGFDWMTCPVEAKELGEKCYGDEECTSDPNARCDTTGTCKCRSSYQLIGSKCVVSGAVTGTVVSVVTAVLCFLVSLQF